MDGFFELIILGLIVFILIISFSAFIEQKYPEKPGLKFVPPTILIAMSCLTFYVSAFLFDGWFIIGVSVLSTTVFISSTIGFIASVFIHNKKEQ
ncbi:MULTISPECIES: YesK family protein [Bacillus cereus group]|uniref:YesK family protein n=1 Tax=Bacillus cereus group TaxID=86661 RepID=UPI0029C5E244|nr:YesK family protein [Bacillus cereus group sp. BfR-BA-02730]MDX5808700.1 YesK family protein [Bacillus cereus group sp. BfR-BA-02730]